MNRAISYKKDWDNRMEATYLSAYKKGKFLAVKTPNNRVR